MKLIQYLLLKNKQNISKGLNINDSNDINIIYTTKNIYDSRSNTTNEISGGTNVITLANESQELLVKYFIQVVS